MRFCAEGVHSEHIRNADETRRSRTVQSGHHDRIIRYPDSICVWRHISPNPLGTGSDDQLRIPDILKAHDHWAPFRVTWDRDAGKFNKGPRPGFRSNDPSTWISFEKACARITEDTAIAYALSPEKLTDTGLIVIDIDHCFSDSKLAAAATRIIQLFAGTYMEISVSGDGVHIFLYGRTGMNGCEKLIVDGTELDIEVYSSGRFMVITGNLIDGGTSVILNMQEQLDTLESLRPDLIPATRRPVPVTPVVAPVPVTPVPNTVSATSDYDLKKLREALSYLDPTHYSDWFGHGIALKRWGEANDREDDALALFDEWSRATKKTNYNTKGNRTKWDSWDCAVENGLTVASIFHAALQAGYAVYMSSGPGQMYRITAQGIDAVDTG